jgi:sporulation protein YlmC with PRC-barrel domain
MAHVGTLRDYRFQGDIDDIRGSNIYNRDDDKLGSIEDIIFNHASGDIEYLVVDTGGWLSSHKFLVPADHISATDEMDRYYVNLTKEQIEAFPEYNEKLHENNESWDDYENRYHESWTESGGILHREGSQNILTPDADEMPPVRGDIHADVTPTRVAPKPARAEDTSTPGTPINTERAGWQETSEGVVSERDPEATADLSERYPVQDRGRRWRAFEDNLRRNRVDITASCRSCAPAKDKAA